MKRPIHLLVADDHLLIREVVKLILAGVREIQLVGEASHGREVIELVKTMKVDVILMDVHMPKLDGIQTTYYLTQHFPQIKVLAFTQPGEDENYYIEDMLTAGARGYLYKSAKVPTIVEAVKAVASGQFYQDKV